MLFREYRDLLTKQAELEAELMRLTGESAASSARAEAAEDRVKDLKSVVDSYSYQATRRNVFARSEAPVPQPAVENPAPRRILARDLATQLTREAMNRQQGIMQSFREEQQIQPEAQSA